jgi:glucokinase
MRIGIDFGGTRIKAAIVREGEIIHSTAVDTPHECRPDEVLALMATAVQNLGVKPRMAGLAIPGHVDTHGMVWRLPNVPGFEGLKIGKLLGEELSCTVQVENDATAAAVGENLWGRGRGFATFLMVTLGTGIGGGLVVNNTLCRGAHGFSAEIGHMRINRPGSIWPCACGQRGCVEAYAGTRGLLRMYRELGGNAQEIDEIFEAARQRDTAALKVFEHLGQTLGKMIVNVQNVLDLEAVVFSGGVSGAFTLFEPSLRDTIREQSFAPPLGQIPLLLSELGSRASLVGAAYLPSLRENPPSLLPPPM